MTKYVRAYNFEGFWNVTFIVPLPTLGDPQNIDNRYMKWLLVEVDKKQRREAEKARLSKQEELARPIPFIEHLETLNGDHDRA